MSYQADVELIPIIPLRRLVDIRLDNILKANALFGNCKNSFLT